MNTPICMENERVNDQAAGDNQLAHPIAGSRLQHQSSTSMTFVENMVLPMIDGITGSTTRVPVAVEDASTTALLSTQMTLYEEEEKDSILTIIDKVFEVLDKEKYRKKKQTKTQMKRAKRRQH